MNTFEAHLPWIKGGMQTLHLRHLRVVRELRPVLRHKLKAISYKT